MKIFTHDFGGFKLDGGSMFGAVPKTIWNKLIPADDRNRIRLATRSLVIVNEQEVTLIDCGMGNKWSEKLKDIYAVETISPLKLNPTQVILTHLHFDHAGGLTYLDKNSQLQLTYPTATHFLQAKNFEHAQNPGPREKASYLEQNILPLKTSNLTLLNGAQEISKHISVHQIDGHTLGQQWVKVTDKSATYVFPSDLIPTSHHLPLAYHMGYDMCTRELLEEKHYFLEQAIQNNWIIVFQHDPDLPAARIEKKASGQMEISKVEIAAL